MVLAINKSEFGWNWFIYCSRDCYSVAGEGGDTLCRNNSMLYDKYMQSVKNYYLLYVSDVACVSNSYLLDFMILLCIEMHWWLFWPFISLHVHRRKTLLAWGKNIWSYMNIYTLVLPSQTEPSRRGNGTSFCEILLRPSFRKALPHGKQWGSGALRMVLSFGSYPTYFPWFIPMINIATTRYWRSSVHTSRNFSRRRYFGSDLMHVRPFSCANVSVFKKRAGLQSVTFLWSFFWRKN